MVISDTELKQVVYAFKCNNSTLQIKGKINSITLGKDLPVCGHILKSKVN
jgi:adenylyl cyclase-associated protein